MMQDIKLGYTGIVKILKYKKNKLVSKDIIKNTGTNDMFRLICTLLEYKYSDDNRNTRVKDVLPGKLNIYYKNVLKTENADTEHKYSGQTLLNIPITCVDAETEINTFSIEENEDFRLKSEGITYTFYLYNNNISENTSIVGADSTYYVLQPYGIDKGENTVYAYVDTGKTVSDFRDIADDEVYVIKWTLLMGNAPSNY